MIPDHNLPVIKRMSLQFNVSSGHPELTPMKPKLILSMTPHNHISLNVPAVAVDWLTENY